MGFSAPGTQHAVGDTGGINLGTVSATLPLAVTAGSVVCVSLTWFNGTQTDGGTVTIADENGKTYTLTPHSPSNTVATSAGAVYLAYLLAPSGAGKTITVTTTINGQMSLVVDEFKVSGGTSAFDNDAAGTGGPSTTISTPTVPVAGSGELCYCLAAGDVANITSVDSPWTQSVANGGAGEGVGYILSQGANVAINMTAGASDHWDSIGMSFSFTPNAAGDLSALVGEPVTGSSPIN